MSKWRMSLDEEVSYWHKRVRELRREERLTESEDAKLTKLLRKVLRPAGTD